MPLRMTEAYLRISAILADYTRFIVYSVYYTHPVQLQLLKILMMRNLQCQQSKFSKRIVLGHLKARRLLIQRVGFGLWYFLGHWHAAIEIYSVSYLLELVIWLFENAF